ncbi:MAG: hypothetical protein WEB02_06520 [Methylophaga sp.]
MSTATTQSVTLSWWNSSLSPKGGFRTKAHLEEAKAVILYLIKSQKVDFLAIGEVSETYSQVIEDLLFESNYEYEPCLYPSGKSKFNHGYIYNSEKISIVDREILKFKENNRSYRLGHAITLRTIYSEVPVLLIVSHWPSNLYENKVIKNKHGINLKRYIDDLRSNYFEESHIILMGDYNLDPFEECLTDYLLATRDRSLVIKKPELFYNPYWRSLGLSECSQFCGSYYYKSGNNTRWHLFDQIMFSAPFIKEYEWRLLEEGKIIGHQFLVEMITDHKKKFDHLPVIAKLEKINV